MSNAKGSTTPMLCCDNMCVGSNHCKWGGFQCKVCGKFFCVGDIDENEICFNCKDNKETENGIQER